MYNKTNITQLGMCAVVIKFKNIKKLGVCFIVVPGNGQCTAWDARHSST